jgi:polyhydroxybutyrate depolymerase
VSTQLTGDNFVERIGVNGQSRTFRVHIPSSVTPDVPAPLILAYHGVGIDAAVMEQHTGLNAAADVAGVVVVYPESAAGVWDISDTGEEFGIDDVAFTRGIVAFVSQYVSIDRARVVAVGLSNGALMAERLGCDAADLLAAFVSVSGTMLRKLPDQCQPSRAINAVFILGSEDRHFPVAGTVNLLSVDSTMAVWKSRNACDTSRESAVLPDTSGDGTIVHRTVFTACAAGVRVRIDSIVGGGHGWPGARYPLNPQVVGVTSRNLSANEEIVRFLLSLPRGA